MIIVTGGAGFIGSRLIQKLNDQGIEDIVVVDDLTDGRKFSNLTNLKFLDYVDKDDFIHTGDFDKEIKCIFHMGAISTTTETDGKKMLRENYDYSKELLLKCEKAQVPFIYASSMAVYGNDGKTPLNVYGYSKKLLDQFVERILPQHESQIVGLRFANVYGPGEQFKGDMASPFFRFWKEGQEKVEIALFSGDDGHGGRAEQHKRDFVYVDDVIDVCLWFMKNKKSGIFDVGSGEQHTFPDVLKTVYPTASVNYIQPIRDTNDLGYIYPIKINSKPFPQHLKGKTQINTKADLTKLREIGYDGSFKDIKQGWSEYKLWIKNQKI